MRHARLLLALLALLVVVGALPARPAAALSPAAPAAPAAQAPDCDPERDLAGELVADGQGRVVNRSADCSYPVGLAAYRMVDGSLRNQELADWETAQIGPGQELTLAVDLPTCSAQVDLFYGPLIVSFAGERYDERRLDDRIIQGSGRCRPAPPTCAVYAVARQGDRQAHLLALDPRRPAAVSLGALPDRSDLRGLAVGPDGALYAVSGPNAAAPGALLTIDRAGGPPSLVGPSGFPALSALAAHPDGTLWAWAPAAGLLRLDPATGAGTLALAASEPVTALAWAADGGALYAAAGRSLYRHTPGGAALELLGADLPAGLADLAPRPDGLLLAGMGRPGGLRLLAVDPQTRQPGAEIDINSDLDTLVALAWPQGCGNPSAGGEAEIITGVSVDPAQVCAGQDVLVRVLTRHPETPGGPVDVAINGQWGAERYLRLSGEPGPRPIQITAVTAEQHVDQRQLSVELIACDPAPPSLDVTLRPHPFRLNVVDFEVQNHAALAASGATYSWEFGDGQSTTTSPPYAAHDYGPALERDAAYTSFQATITLRRPGQPDLVARKSVTVWSQYALSKERGFLQPPVSAPERLPGGGALSIDVRNLEDEPLRLSSRTLELQYCDPARDPLARPAEAIDLSVPARGQAAHSFTSPAEALAADVCGLSVTLAGAGPGNMPAYASAYVEVRRNPQLTRPVSDPATLALLNQVAGQGMVADPRYISGADLYRLAREQRVQYPIPPAGTIGGPRVAAAAEPAAPESSAYLGEPCNVGDPAPRPGLTCEPSGEWDWVPPRIANAYKGDTILTAGCGMIGELLRQVAPPQRYSHSGLMVENFYSIRHSTAAEDRYRDKDYGEGIVSQSDGIRADILQYGWPGIITQSVDAAYNGEWLRDPVNGKLYKVSGFSADPVQCDGDLTLSYPLVVRPVPGAAAEVRARLHQAADLAQGMEGHYRFFGYTNAAVSEDRAYDAPASLSWDGVQPRLATVCSSFVWTVLRAAGIVLEGPAIEEADMRQGAERDGATVDGLYLYTQAERRAGAEWLYANVYNEAKEEAGWFGNFLTGAADDIANQLVNCFGSDQCGEKDDQLWKRPGAGRAVSPDNILFWDSPAQGGVYGYSEPIAYRQAEYVQRSRWAAAPNVGTITGRVLYQGQPLPGAAVRLAGLELASGADGRFRDELVPAGSYTVVASASSGGLSLETTAQVTIVAGQTTSIDLVLQPLPDYFREVIVQGSMFIVDSESWPDDDETGTFAIDERRFLNPTRRSDSIRISHCVGAEVRIELDIDLQLQNDNRSVRATGEARMYEGTSCSTDDFEDRESFAHTVAPAASQSVAIFLENTEFLGGDTADIGFQVINATQPRLVASPATPEEGGALRSAAGDLELRVPAGALVEAASLTYAPGAAHAAPAGGQILRAFSLAAVGDGGAEAPMARPASLTLRYDQAALERRRIDPGTLRLARWDGERWVALPVAGHDRAGGSLRVELDQLGPLALLADGSQIHLPLLMR